MKISKEKRNKVILVGIGTSLIMAAIWLTLMSAQRAAIDRTQKEIKEEELKLANGERLLKSQDQVEAQLNSYLATLQSVEAGMASGDMYAWLIRTFNTFKANYRVEIPQFSREVLGEVGMLPKFPYKAAIFSIRGTAQYHELGRFIADFENRYPFIRIQNLELEPASAGGSEAPADVERLSFRFEIVALIRNEIL